MGTLQECYRDAPGGDWDVTVWGFKPVSNNFTGCLGPPLSDPPNLLQSGRPIRVKRNLVGRFLGCLPP